MSGGGEEGLAGREVIGDTAEPKRVNSAVPQKILEPASSKNLVNAPAAPRYFGSGGDRSGRTGSQFVILDRTFRGPPTGRGYSEDAAVLLAVKPLVPFPGHEGIEFLSPRDNETCACFPLHPMTWGGAKTAGLGEVMHA